MGSGAGQSRRTCTGTSGAPRAESQDIEEHTSPGRGCGCHAYCTVNIRLYGTLVHFVAHLVFQEKYSLTTATSCRFLDRANEMRSFRTIVRCCSLVRPQRSRSSQLYGRVPYNWDAYNRILTVPARFPGWSLPPTYPHPPFTRCLSPRRNPGILLLANLDAWDASGATARADARAKDGRTPQTGTEEANGANVADGKGVEFGAQPGAGDGAKTAHGAAVKLDTGRRR